ncbi:MAG: GDSL-type esterase/lipase family protein [bacterium]|nr:GDSL-type esterase/lipase family protein [bacterium]
MRRLVAVTLVAVLIVLVAGWFYSTSRTRIHNAPVAPLASDRPIVALGDSLTAGFGAAPDADYPSRLAALLGRPIINCGVNGDTIADVARRLDRDVLALRPAVVIVLLGGNDLLQQRNLDQSFNQLRAIVERIQAREAMVVLVGLDGLSPLGGIGGRYKQLARDTGCLFVPDVLDGIFGHATLMADAVHPNARGYDLVARRIAKAMKPLVGP